MTDAVLIARIDGKTMIMRLLLTELSRDVDSVMSYGGVLYRRYAHVTIEGDELEAFVYDGNPTDFMPQRHRELDAPQGRIEQHRPAEP